MRSEPRRVASRRKPPHADASREDGPRPRAGRTDKAEPDLPVSETFLLVLCLSCAGVISGLTGFAFALVASGTLLSIRPPVEATALVLACSILSQSLSILRLRTAPPRATALAMIGPGLLGAPIGIYLLHDLNPNLVKVRIGRRQMGADLRPAWLRVPGAGLPRRRHPRFEGISRRPGATSALSRPFLARVASAGRVALGLAPKGRLAVACSL